ncbi:MAG: corrinoid protein [Proteobacteria bacterium]|nr:corrinoid protein [Pseudomonadota bacterium]MBU1387412.1 corrinoid protein [Pseudomonadota bacterium]MBU1541697.1 corrinoid protein [Pseudomonadota bacterium]MBU2429932.1 corrinoid protein [Pseudomonadota bacterium]MBU2482000.1 corrinoid protein [Pseudomonadota bacterium]
MEEKEKQIICRLASGVKNMDEKMTVEAANEALVNHIDPTQAINNGLLAGMNQAGLLYETEEYFVPELLLCSDALYAGLDVLTPHIKSVASKARTRMVIGVVQGDTHDIGKNLVKLMFETSGFDVLDLGRDVPLNAFVDKVKEVQAQLLCMSTLMSTTMDGMARVIEKLEQEGIRNTVRVMVGGGPLNQSFAHKIGADGYAKDAIEAVRTARQLLTSGTEDILP